MSQTQTTDVALIGAGPIGIEMAVALKRAGVDYLHFDAGRIAETIARYPRNNHFFSSNERIAIAGMPIQTLDQSKATREEYLAYLRTIVGNYQLQIQTHTPVTDITRTADGFALTISPATGPQLIRAKKVILAKGDMDRPNRIDIPGEDLPHVTHYFEEPHAFFGGRLLIVGGKNSAAEAALRCYHAGIDVTISYRRSQMNQKSVKYWLLPELEGRIKRGEIAAHFSTAPLRIAPGTVTLAPVDHDLQADANTAFDVVADHVLLATGFAADMDLYRAAGVELTGPAMEPTHDPETMETNVPGLFVAGTTCAGSQQSYRLFIENCHVHVVRIINALTGDDAPAPPPVYEMPES